MSDIYIQSMQSMLSLSQKMLMVKDAQREIQQKIPLSDVDNILIFGNSQLTTPLIKYCSRQGINIYYFSSSGKFLSAVESYREEDFEKQRCQAKASFSEGFCLELSKIIIAKKIRYQVDLLKAYDTERLLLDSDLFKLEDMLDKVRHAQTLQEVMGYEGRSAKSYFYYLSLMLPHAFRFKGRSKRPAEDPFNCVLNLGYSLLYSFFIGMIRQNGLSQGFGFLHQPRRHHAVLASDLMEEWRAVIVDDTMMHLIMSGQLVLAHFELNDHSGYTLTAEGLALVVSELRQRMLEIHPYQRGDSHRYSFVYMADQQIKRLIRAMVSLQASDYRDGGDEDEIV